MKKRKITKAKTQFEKSLNTDLGETIKNALLTSVFGFDISNYGAQINQLDTLFRNNRWTMISNLRQLLSEIYVEHGIIQTMIDIPVDDAIRGGITIKTDQLKPAQVADLENHMERQNDLTTSGQAEKWNRLYGGAGNLIITDQDPATPLKLKEIKKSSTLDFHAVDMWELFYDHQNIEDIDKLNTVYGMFNLEHYNYYGNKIHKSRVMLMKGLVAPSFLRPRLRGWGYSVVESVIRELNQYIKAPNVIFEILDEFKVDVYKIQGLASSTLNPAGTSKMQKLVQMVNEQKNFMNAIVLDKEDDFAQKQLVFTGLAEIFQQIRIQIAACLRMPLTKLFGVSAAGFSSGEDDIENYNAMIESQIRSKMKYSILRVIELRCVQLYGMIPTDLSFEFQPLRVLSAVQEEEVKTAQFNRVLQAMQLGYITGNEFKESINKNNLLPISITSTPEVSMDEDLGEVDEDNPDSTDTKEQLT